MTQLIYIKQTQGNGNGEAGKNLGLAPTQKDNLAMNFNNLVSKYHKQLNDVQPIMPEANTNTAPVVPDITPVVDNLQAVTPPVADTNPVNDTPVVSPVSTPVNNEVNDVNNVIEPFAPNSPSIDSVINPTVTPVSNEVSSEVTSGDPLVTPIVSDNTLNEVTPAPVNNVEVNPVNTGVVDNVENTNVGPEIIPTVQETEIDLLLKAIEQEQAQLLLNIQDMITQHNKKIKDLLMSSGSKINENLAQAQEYKKQAEGFVKDAQAAAQVADIARQNAMNLQKENIDTTSVMG